MFYACRSESAHKVLMIKLLIQTRPQRTMRLHRTADDLVCKGVFGHGGRIWKDSSTDSGNPKKGNIKKAICGFPESAGQSSFIQSFVQIQQLARDHGEGGEPGCRQRAIGLAFADAEEGFHALGMGGEFGLDINLSLRHDLGLGR